MSPFELDNPKRGVVGLVEELLRIVRQRDLRLSWRAGRCLLEFPADGSLDPIELPLPRSVARAAIARFAALCDERTPGSVSPYEGRGELMIDGDLDARVRVEFVNTPTDPSLELTRIATRPPVALDSQGERMETKRFKAV